MTTAVPRFSPKQPLVSLRALVAGAPDGGASDGNRQNTEQDDDGDDDQRQYEGGGLEVHRGQGHIDSLCKRKHVAVHGGMYFRRARCTLS